MLQKGVKASLVLFRRLRSQFAANPDELPQRRSHQLRNHRSCRSHTRHTTLTRRKKKITPSADLIRGRTKFTKTVATRRKRRKETQTPPERRTGRHSRKKITQFLTQSAPRFRVSFDAGETRFAPWWFGTIANR